MLRFLGNNYTNFDSLGFKPEIRPRDNPALSSKILFKKIAQFKPDLLFTYEKILAPQEIEQIVKLGIKLVTNTCGVHSLYYGAPPITQPEAISLLRQHAMYLVSQAAHIARLRDERVNALEFPFWYDSDWFHPLPIEKKYDIFFVGDFSAPLNTNRLELLTVLAQNFRVTLASGQNPQISNLQYLGVSEDPRQLNLWFNQSRLVIGSDRLSNIQVMNNLPGQYLFYEDDFFIRGRTYLALGSGACYLVEKNQAIEKKFNDGEEIVLWDNYPDLLEKAQQLLANHVLREQIAQNAYQKTLAEHSTPIRARQLVDLLECL